METVSGHFIQGLTPGWLWQTEGEGVRAEGAGLHSALKVRGGILKSMQEQSESQQRLRGVMSDWFMALLYVRTWFGFHMIYNAKTFTI